MIKLDSTNTTGKIANFLLTYEKSMKMAYTIEHKDFIKWISYYEKNIDNKKMVLSFDIETKKLYPIDNFLTWFSLAYKYNDIYYSCAFGVENWNKEDIIEAMNRLSSLKSKIVLHNAYFDITTLNILYGINMRWDYDTYIIFHSLMLHRAKDDSKDNDFGMENTGLSLKDLTRDYLVFGDYEEELNQWKKKYCSANKIKLKDFTYDLFPKEVIAPYNNMDTTSTLQLFEKGNKIIKKFEDIGYTSIRKIIKDKHLITNEYIEARCRGIKVDRKKIFELYEYYKETRDESYKNIFIDMKDEIEQVERLNYKLKLEKLLMTDFQYFASGEGKPKKNSKGEIVYKLIPKKVNCSDLKSKRILEESKINLNSTNHKRRLFCDIMGFEALEKTKTGEDKVDLKFLDYYGEREPKLKNFINYGKCRTAINNFLGVEKLDGEDDDYELGQSESKTLCELTNDEIDTIYPSYNLLGTVSSRCSCSSPNLQQYPSRGVLKRLKECFIPRKDHYFVYADYSSAEVVILGSIINSKRIHQSLENKWDLHSMNAWSMLKEEILKVHPDWEEKFINCGDDIDKLRDFYKGIKSEFEQTVRYKTKSLVFSLAYGVTAHGIAKNLKIDKKEAQDLINKYMKANPEMKAYIQKQHAKAIKLGYTENPFGARLLLPDCINYNSTNDRQIKMRAEKQLKKSLNIPIQSSNAFLLYDGICRAKKLLKENNLSDKVHFMFSVYDSFCYEVHDSVKLEEIVDILERSFICMLGDFYLGIDLEYSKKSWGEMEEIKRPRRNKEDITIYDIHI